MLNKHLKNMTTPRGSNLNTKTNGNVFRCIFSRQSEVLSFVVFHKTVVKMIFASRFIHTVCTMIILLCCLLLLLVFFAINPSRKSRTRNDAFRRFPRRTFQNPTYISIYSRRNELNIIIVMPCRQIRFFLQMVFFILD